LKEPFKKLFVSTPPPVLLVVAHFGSPAAVQGTNGIEGGERIYAPKTEPEPTPGDSLPIQDQVPAGRCNHRADTFQAAQPLQPQGSLVNPIGELVGLTLLLFVAFVGLDISPQAAKNLGLVMRHKKMPDLVGNSETFAGFVTNPAIDQNTGVLALS
jgi:hypothetical protein